jgi:hypothetical protein
MKGNRSTCLVAQDGILLYRRLVICGSWTVPTFTSYSHPAEYHSATQQIANLRYPLK